MLAAGKQLIQNENRILLVRQEDALLDPQPFDVVGPDRQAHLEAELGEVACAMRVRRVAGPFAASDLETASIRASHLLGDVAQHHHAAERAGQR